MNAPYLPPISKYVPSGQAKCLDWDKDLKMVKTSDTLSPSKGYAELAPKTRTDNPYLFYCDPSSLDRPDLISISSGASSDLLLSDEKIKDSDNWLQLLSGQATICGFPSYASIYAGHQFGVFVPRLGDGRAINIGMINNHELQLKGSGSTPYARHADGRAVLRSSIREFLCSEALHGLGIPTTRALSIFSSQTPVYREKIESGSVICRVAPTFVRFGNFEYLSSQRHNESLLKLVSYLQNRIPQFVDLNNIPNSDTEGRIGLFLKIVCTNTADLIANWMSVGFMHGVMNTDNFSIIGQTIDYGPFGFMDQFNSDHVCNHSDYHGRYSYNNQPDIALWNLIKLVQSFRVITSEKFIQETEEKIIELFSKNFTESFNTNLRLKLGFIYNAPKKNEWNLLITEMFSMMQSENLDFTLFFRNLAYIGATNDSLEKNIYLSKYNDNKSINDWVQKYKSLLFESIKNHPQSAYRNSDYFLSEIKKNMKSVNPAIVLRNWIAEEIIQDVSAGNYKIMEKALKYFENPCMDYLENEEWSKIPPDWSKNLEVSCSS